MTAAAAPHGLVAEAAALAQRIRGAGATTCCCHIVVDDPNFDDGAVAHCLMRAARLEHPACLRLALLLVRASLTQRRRINYWAWQG